MKRGEDLDTAALQQNQHRLHRHIDLLALVAVSDLHWMIWILHQDYLGLLLMRRYAIRLDIPLICLRHYQHRIGYSLVWTE